jgi:alginate O-acetyltransferase complex protein AlgI
MVFSEPTFLFLFLPLALAAYFLSPKFARNGLLLFFSLVFYAWGEDEYVGVLLAVIALNYLAGFAIAGARSPALARMALYAGVAANLGALVYFKYAYFLVSKLTSDAGLIEAARTIHLPIGISFFIFQSLTYLIDLHARAISLQKSFPALALYVSLFPQLIAGPIVRYSEVEKELRDRHTSASDFAAGTERFIIGLAKKTLIADPMGILADRIFAVPDAGLSTPVAWLGVVAYTLQIFFDFSAYSDMAIGLGRIFGFRFPENFDFPYISQSITEFWRRWHMTLSRWFRDYLYIPLGGNRKGPIRTYFNLSVVFLLCGLWHGASWNFALWGAYHGALLVAERAGLGAALARAPQVLRHAYVMLAVMIGWTPFRAETLGQTLAFYERMFAPGAGPLAAAYPVERFLDPYIALTLIVGVVLSTPAHRLLARTFGGARARPAAAAAGYCALLAIAVLAAGAADYSPFIYFRF